MSIRISVYRSSLTMSDRPGTGLDPLFHPRGQVFECTGEDGCTFESRRFSRVLNTPQVAENAWRKRVADCKHGFESRWGRHGASPTPGATREAGRATAWPASSTGSPCRSAGG